MNDERLQRWGKFRVTGKKKFLTCVTLAHGLFWAIGMISFKYYFHPEKVDGIFIIVLIPAALLFGYSMSKFHWWQIERKYSQLMKKAVII